MLTCFRIDRIRSWAKAHASNRDVAAPPADNARRDQDDEKAPATQRNTDLTQDNPGASADPGGAKGTEGSPNALTRTKDGIIRCFVKHTKDAVCYSWVNVLLVFVPVGIAAEAVHLSPAVIFAMNAVAIVPLAGLLSHATESVASRLGDTVGALLNVTFGNAVELIILYACVSNHLV